MEPSFGITLSGVGKRHGRSWILRGIDLEVPPGCHLAILGANGSGKSSLLRLMNGFDRPSEGDVTWRTAGASMEPMEVPLEGAYCAPDQDLIPDLTVQEHIALHHNLRTCLSETDVETTMRLALLHDKGDVRVRHLSSGMRQRLALTLAFTTDSRALFLDEPTSHLDRNGKDWYARLMSDWRRGRTTIVASNHDPQDYPGADSTWEIPAS